ncbi:hypothetical protein PHLH6_54900 [Pseudomonas sp. Seg1]|nr:hypothetical protein PHLH6_54900 [Pseudomonas sp. Seg1]
MHLFQKRRKTFNFGIKSLQIKLLGLPVRSSPGRLLAQSYLEIS